MDDRVRRRVRVTAELVVEVEDSSALRDAAFAYVDRPGYVDDALDPVAAGRARVQDRAAVGEDSVAALELLLDPVVIFDPVPGVRAVDAGFRLVEVDEDGHPVE